MQVSVVRCLPDRRIRGHLQVGLGEGPRGAKPLPSPRPAGLLPLGAVVLLPGHRYTGSRKSAAGFVLSLFARLLLTAASGARSCVTPGPRLQDSGSHSTVGGKHPRKGKWGTRGTGGTAKKSQQQGMGRSTKPTRRRRRLPCSEQSRPCWPLLCLPRGRVLLTGQRTLTRGEVEREEGRKGNLAWEAQGRSRGSPDF